MSVVLYHHPWSRAATVVWMLEEVGIPYELHHVDLQQGEQLGAEHRAVNPMSKVPVLVDGEAVVTESAAIGVYLADRYAPGVLAPEPFEPARGAFLRWCFYAPSVVEPGCMARAAGWDFKPGQAGWGRYEDMLTTLEQAVGDGPWLLGDAFTMADVILGGTVGWMLRFGMLDARPAFTAWHERLAARPARKRADAINARVAEEHGLEGA